MEKSEAWIKRKNVILLKCLEERHFEIFHGMPKTIFHDNRARKEESERKSFDVVECTSNGTSGDMKRIELD